MTSAYAQLQRMGRLLLRAQGFRLREERTAAGRRFFLYERDGRGSGPPLLLVHGLGGAATSFASIASKCARLSRRVLLIDLPGHGLAALGEGEKPAGALELTQALARVLELASEPVLLVGNSLGGGLVLGAALLWPEKIAGAVGLAPAGAPFTEAESLQVRTVFRGGAESGGELGRRLFHTPPFAVRLVARGLGAHIAEPAVQHIVGHIHQGDQSLPQEQLRSLRVPVLVLWGDDDQVLPASGADYFRAALPSGSVEVLEQCGHLPQIERAGLVLKRLERFISALPPRAARA
jgi:pimeloyl-ACP methyl ester carboxylesterase